MRVKVCHSCREFVPIASELPLNELILQAFTGSHRNHMVSISLDKELDESYKLFDYQKIVGLRK